jgi:hypothetical protein
MDVGRRLMIAACVVLVGLVLALGFGAGSGVAAPSCSQPCGTGIPTAVSTKQSSIPCLRDAACSGGVALGNGAGVGTVIVLPAVLALLILAGGTRRRRPARRLPLGRLADGGLFRPPRVLLGI